MKGDAVDVAIAFTTRVLGNASCCVDNLLHTVQNGHVMELLAVVNINTQMRMITSDLRPEILLEEVPLFCPVEVAAWIRDWKLMVG